MGFVDWRFPAWLGICVSLGACLASGGPKEPEVTSSDYASIPFIMEAAQKGDTAALSQMIAAKADVNARDQFGETPLIYAAVGGRSAAVRLLIDHGAQIEARDDFHRTALIEAATHGYAAVAQTLLSYGASVGRKDLFGRTALMYAAIYDHVPVAKILIAEGADPNELDPWDASALSFAAAHGYREMVEALLPRAKITEMVIANARTAGQDDIAELLARAKGLPALAQSLPPVPDEDESRDDSMPSTRPDDSPNGSVYSDVDVPPPSVAPVAESFALVVGIERYWKVPQAAFAVRDATTIKDYLAAMGYPPRNIVYLTGPNATQAVLQGYLEEWFPRNLRRGSRFFLYYAGHGASNPATRQSYLIPWDGDPEFLDKTAFSLKRLYADLARLKARRITVVLDSCFSGLGPRSIGMPGRPLATEVSLGTPSKNVSLLAAATGAQIAGILPQQGHGLFTYYLLKGLGGAAEDSNKKVVLEDLYRYLAPLVKKEAAYQNRAQDPLLLTRTPGQVLVRWASPPRDSGAARR